MCGINFFLDKKNLQDEKIIQQMNKAIFHRGNENSDYFCHQNLYVGHNRLKILDLSSEANQPFLSEDKEFALVFNGEIYNYQHLKKELLEKYTFKTHSDTEVLLYFLMENKDEKQLNGIYAYIFVDLKNNTIKFNRDKLGIKPLYMFENDDYLLISSEIKGILASRLLEKKLNTSQILPYLYDRFVEKNQTFFENIIPVCCKNERKINPNLIFFESEDKIFEEEIFEEIIFEEIIFEEKKEKSKKNIFTQYTNTQKINELDNLLRQAVLSQCFADVPIGIFLSGGVDSTLLLAYLQENNYPKPTAFTIIHEKKDIRFVSEDTNFAEKAAKKFNAHWEPVLITSNVLDNFQEFVSKIDNPIADASFLLTYHLAEKASKTHKVVFTGAGADEMFAGYHRHQAFYSYLQLKKIFGTSWITLFKNIPTTFLGRKWRKLVEKIDFHSPTTFVHFTQTHWQTNKNFFFNIPTNDNLKWALEYERANFLSEDVLKINDLAAMLHSVEIRVPFLDNTIIDFVDNLETNFLLKNGKKWLLKQLLINKGGKEFANRKKEGFGMAFGEWTRQEKYKKLIVNTLHKKHIIFDYLSYSIFIDFWEKHQAQKADFSNEIFGIWFLAEWLNQNFN
ncbi:MAG: asparagine synthase (glutamine-hydrolyzing) [Bacteroidetes bacterium]|nr:MAG: asparagine synthase (glutamine-hydrolyzing) [Bacteroidota bacterium]TAG85741.1 MAG: asparagine synthase (glutamine-hydrolyzing) [Bacteroidota bacterium]